MSYKWQKDKRLAAKLYYKFDWKALTNGSGNADWLNDGETITDFTISEDSGITVNSSGLTNDNTSITVMLSGGLLNETYDIKCSIVTSDTEEDNRVMSIRIIE